MKKVMKALSLLVAGVLVLACFAGCAGQSGLAQIKEKGELVMLTNAAFPPFEYVENDEVVGVDVDIANEIAKELGVKLTVQDMEFDLIIDYIKAGKGDIGAAGITADDERRKQVDFSVEYITSTQYVIVPAGTDTKTFKLDGKVIGVQEGTTGDVYYASDAEVIKAKEVKKYKSAI
ncbi:MAG: transporter substrate-binding domain-containing protein, partial [Acutalibacteraceae bacterium]